MGEVVDQLVRQGLGAWAEAKGGDELGAGVAGDPEPGRFHLPSQPDPEFIELDMG